jgi:transcriptional regulator with XRE-family HTH domain
MLQRLVLAPASDGAAAMTAVATNPALKRHRLRTGLKKARTAAGLTQRDVADDLDWSASKVIRIEKGLVGVSRTDLKALVEKYEIVDRFDELVELARGSKKQPWAEYSDILSAEARRFFGYEASASIIRQCETSLIPGLLQTEDYTRAILTDVYGLKPSETERHIDVRRQRQQVLEPSPEAPEAFFVLGESVLRWAVGGQAVMRRQLKRMEEIAERPRVTIRILPFSVGANFAMRGPFVYLEFADEDDPNVLYFENAAGEKMYRDDPQAIEPYRKGFQTLEKQVSPDEIGTQVKRAPQELGR